MDESWHAKICVLCGEDCSKRPRTRDRKNRYYCQDCYDAAQFELAANELAPHAPVASRRAPAPAPVETRRTPSRAPAALCLVGFVALAAAGVVAIALGRTVTGIFALFVAVAGLNGFWLGAARIAAIVGGLLVAAVLAVPLGKMLEGTVGGILSLTGLTGRMVSIAVVGIAIIIVITLLLHLVLRGALRKRPKWKPYDRIAGSGFGLLEGSLLGLLLMWSVLALEPVASTSVGAGAGGASSAATPARADNAIAQTVLALAERTRESTVGRVAAAINPLDELRLITIFEKGLMVLNDEAARDAFIEHPSMVSIREHPSVQQAMDMLLADAEIREILEADGPITSQQLRAILDSRTVLSVIDDTTIVRDVKPMAESIGDAILAALRDPTSATPRHVRELYPDPDQMVALVMAGLEDANPYRRMRAANTLAGMGARAAAAIPAMLETLEGEREPQVRVAVITALGNLGRRASAAVPLLERHLQDPDVGVRDAAKAALRRIVPDEGN